MNTDISAKKQRAEIIYKYDSLLDAINSGELNQFQDLSLSEALVLGLLSQGVKKYVGIFGHGSTDIGDILRIYQEAGVVRVYNVRNETEASHAAAQLRWQYEEHCAVFTSIGPGALHAFAGSLVPKSNGLGVYYIFGDETSHNEGPNMQQIPGFEQDKFLRLTSVMSGSYSLGTPEAIFTALKWGYSTVFNPKREGPFFLHLPMNIQGKIMEELNLLELPVHTKLSLKVKADDESCIQAALLIKKYSRITLKSGGGARGIEPEVLSRFLELSGAVYVHGPQVPGLLPYSNDRNMSVGGSKGTISGNYAMENCELLIVLGSRGVCQWDSSGTAWKKTREIININTQLEDALHYNRTLPLVGDGNEILRQLNKILEKQEKNEDSDFREWIKKCRAKRSEWDLYMTKRKNNPLLYDEKWGRKILTQPGAIMCVVDFAVKKKAVKIFDAGDVQANGFQIVQDDLPRMTYNETGSSYMGFAVSALLASGMTDKPDYSIAFTGDGSFLMTPQILLDAVNFGVKGMIVLFDNRKMAAISSLQEAQYGRMFATDDNVEVDYIRLASSFKGVSAFDGGYSISGLNFALESAYAHDGLSLVYVSVYSGSDEMGGLGVYGSWNVGSWCDRVQKEKHKIGL